MNKLNHYNVSEITGFKFEREATGSIYDFDDVWKDYVNFQTGNGEEEPSQEETTVLEFVEFATDGNPAVVIIQLGHKVCVVTPSNNAIWL